MDQQRIIRKPEIIGRSGMSDATIWRMERIGKFPRRFKIGGNSVGWLSDEFDAWLAERIKNRVQLAGGAQ